MLVELTYSRLMIVPDVDYMFDGFRCRVVWYFVIFLEFGSYLEEPVRRSDTMSLN